MGRASQIASQPGGGRRQKRLVLNTRGLVAQGIEQRFPTRSKGPRTSVNVRRVFDRDHPSSVVVRPYPALSAEIGCQIGCQMCAAGRGAVTKLPVLWEWRHRDAGKVERNLPKVEVAGSIPVSRSSFIYEIG